VGLNGESFEIFKFRTMVVGAEKIGAQLTAGKDPRITSIGHLLRKTKIDELPQLINVFFGQMGLVGPRPEVRRYVNQWSALDTELILSVKPGITDDASLVYSDEQGVLARWDDPEKAYLNEVMPRKLGLYRQYVAERSLWLDFRMILATLAKIAGFDSSRIGRGKILRRKWQRFNAKARRGKGAKGRKRQKKDVEGMSELLLKLECVRRACGGSGLGFRVHHEGHEGHEAEIEYTESGRPSGLCNFDAVFQNMTQQRARLCFPHLRR
jgi:lipopolysaccharide/colanic/teichoic acid biosynthesis glycosyltransferase